MRIEWESEPETGRIALAASVEVHDAWPPHSRLTVDASLAKPSVDRIAVAAVLAFAPWISSTLVLPDPLSPLTAQRVMEFLAPLWVGLEPIRRGALPIPRGHGTSQFVYALSGGYTDMVVVLPASSDARGIQTFASHLSLGSTARLIAEVGPERTRFLPLVAAAVLLAETFELSILDFPEFPEGDLKERVRRLLEAVSLGVV